MRNNWRAKLTAYERRIFDRSSAVTTIEFDPTPKLLQAVAALPAALAAQQRGQVTALSQTIVNQICRRLRVRTVEVRVHGTRPSNRHGELHGLYTQYAGEGFEHAQHTIEVWMRTAKRKQVVAFRTFLRTLLHEVCHHLDYTYFNFRESYHTLGFFQRESGLFRRLVASATKPDCEAAEFPHRSLSLWVEEILASKTRGRSV